MSKVEIKVKLILLDSLIFTGRVTFQEKHIRLGVYLTEAQLSSNKSDLSKSNLKMSSEEFWKLNMWHPDTFSMTIIIIRCLFIAN